MRREKITKIRTGDKLYKEYELWKVSAFKDSQSVEFRAIILADTIDSSRKLTSTFKRYEDICKSDIFCLKRYSTDKLEIHKLI